MNQSIVSVFIPVQEMLANALGFLPIYATRERFIGISCSEIVLWLRGSMNRRRRALLAKIQAAINGRISARDKDHFSGAIANAILNSRC